MTRQIAACLLTLAVLTGCGSNQPPPSVSVQYKVTLTGTDRASGCRALTWSWFWQVEFRGKNDNRVIDSSPMAAVGRAVSAFGRNPKYAGH